MVIFILEITCLVLGKMKVTYCKDICLFTALFQGTAVVLDFQTFGKGLASNDFAQLINWSYNTTSYEEVEEFSKGNLSLCMNIISLQ